MRSEQPETKVSSAGRLGPLRVLGRLMLGGRSSSAAIPHELPQEPEETVTAEQVASALERLRFRVPEVRDELAQRPHEYVLGLPPREGTFVHATGWSNRLIITDDFVPDVEKYRSAGQYIGPVPAGNVPDDAPRGLRVRITTPDQAPRLPDTPGLNRTADIVLMNGGGTLFWAEHYSSPQFGQWSNMEELSPGDAMSIVQNVADNLEDHFNNP